MDSRVSILHRQMQHPRLPPISLVTLLSNSCIYDASHQVYMYLAYLLSFMHASNTRFVCLFC